MKKILFAVLVTMVSNSAFGQFSNTGTNNSFSGFASSAATNGFGTTSSTGTASSSTASSSSSGGSNFATFQNFGNSFTSTPLSGPNSTATSATGSRTGTTMGGLGGIGGGMMGGMGGGMGMMGMGGMGMGGMGMGGMGMGGMGGMGRNQQQNQRMGANGQQQYTLRPTLKLGFAPTLPSNEIRSSQIQTTMARIPQAQQFAGVNVQVSGNTAFVSGNIAPDQAQVLRRLLMLEPGIYQVQLPGESASTPKSDRSQLWKERYSKKTNDAEKANNEGASPTVESISPGPVVPTPN